METGKLKPKWQITSKVKVDQAEVETKLLVIEDQYQNIPLIIGQPFTEKEYVVVVRKGSTLRIFEDKISIDDCLKNLETLDLPKPKANLWAKDSCIIPPNFVGFVSVYSQEPAKDIYIDKLTEFNKCIPICVD